MKIEANLATRLATFVASMAKSDKGLDENGIGGGTRIVEGWGGKVAKLDFERLSASQGVRPLTRDQIMRLPNDTTGELEDVVVAKAGEFGIAFNLFLEDGRTIAVSALRQSGKSTFVEGDTVTKAIEMKKKDWASLIGKSVVVTKRGEDADITLNREGQPARKANYFTFSVTA